jgi:hypothetical protein
LPALAVLPYTCSKKIRLFLKELSSKIVVFSLPAIPLPGKFFLNIHAGVKEKTTQTKVI